MLLDCLLIQEYLKYVVQSEKPPSLARQAFLTYRNQHCQQARRFDCVLIVMCQKA